MFIKLHLFNSFKNSFRCPMLYNQSLAGFYVYHSQTFSFLIGLFLKVTLVFPCPVVVHSLFCLVYTLQSDSVVQQIAFEGLYSKGSLSLCLYTPHLHTLLLSLLSTWAQLNSQKGNAILSNVIILTPKPFMLSIPHVNQIFFYQTRCFFYLGLHLASFIPLPWHLQ